MNTDTDSGRRDRRMLAINRSLVIAMGVLEILYFICLLFICLRYSETRVEGILFSALFLIFGGIMLLLSYKRQASVIILIATSTYCLYEACGSFLNSLSSFSPVTVISVLMNLLAIGSAVHCYLGDRHSAKRLFMILVIILILETSTAIIIGLLLYMSMEALPLFTTIMLDILFVTLLCIYLSRPGVRDDFFKKRMQRGLLAVEALMSISPNAEIYRKDAEAFVRNDPSIWEKGQEGCPIESRCRIPFRDGKKRFYIVCRKWKGEDGIWMGLDQELKTESFGRAVPLKGCRIDRTESGDYLRIYGDTGYFVKLRVTDEPEPKKGLKGLLRRDDVEEESLNDDVDGIETE